MSGYGEYTPEFENEEQVQEWLEEVFEQHGWSAIREVSPHNSDLRADLLVRNDEFGWIGIEVKHIRSTDCGGQIGKAIQQILSRYQAKKYIGERVSVWCLAPYYTAQNSGHRTSEHMIRSMVNSFGLGYIGLGHYRLMMEFNYSKESKKVFIGDLPQCPYDSSEDYESYGKMDEISKWVENTELVKAVNGERL